MIIQVENAVSDDDCRRLMTIYDRHVQLTKVKDQTGHPVVYPAQFRDTPDAAEMDTPSVTTHGSALSRDSDPGRAGCGRAP
jgi:hypothetical protein